MKTLKDYLREDKNIPLAKKYISVLYDSETQENLRNYCIKYGFDLSKKYNGEDQDINNFKFHTTIFYSTTQHRLRNEGSSCDPSEVYPVTFELLGENKDVPVLKVTSDKLENLRNYFKETYNMEDAWPQYKPHISLSYNRTIIPDMSNIPLPKFPLIFNKIKIEDIDES
jgi:hypothetical protein